jgi:quercetin dioxygenase-like cupin family protein
MNTSLTPSPGAAATSTRDPVLLAPDERERVWFFGGVVSVMATGDHTGDRYAVVEQHLPGGTVTPLHRHREDEESFVVLSGEIVIKAGDAAPARLAAGGFVHVPAGMPHAFAVTSPEVRLLNITTPGHERFIRAAAEPAGAGFPPAGPPDMQRLLPAAGAYGTDILGPPPALD